MQLKRHFVIALKKFGVSEIARRLKTEAPLLQSLVDGPSDDLVRFVLAGPRHVAESLGVPLAQLFVDAGVLRAGDFQTREGADALLDRVWGQMSSDPRLALILPTRESWKTASKATRDVCLLAAMLYSDSAAERAIRAAVFEPSPGPKNALLN